MANRINLSNLSIYDSSNTTLSSGSEPKLTPALASQIETARHKVAEPLASGINSVAGTAARTVQTSVRTVSDSARRYGVSNFTFDKVMYVPLAGTACAMLFLRKSPMVKFSAFVAGCAAATAVVAPEESRFIYSKTLEGLEKSWDLIKPTKD